MGSIRKRGRIYSIYLIDLPFGNLTIYLIHSKDIVRFGNEIFCWMGKKTAQTHTREDTVFIDNKIFNKILKYFIQPPCFKVYGQTCPLPLFTKISIEKPPSTQAHAYNKQPPHNYRWEDVKWTMYIELLSFCTLGTV